MVSPPTAGDPWIVKGGHGPPFYESPWFVKLFETSAVGFPIFYPSISAPADSPSGCFRDRDDCPIYEASRTPVQPKGGTSASSQHGTTAFTLPSNCPNEALILKPSAFGLQAASLFGCIWWNNHRIHRLATAATITHLGLPR